MPAGWREKNLLPGQTSFDLKPDQVRQMLTEGEEHWEIGRHATCTDLTPDGLCGRQMNKPALCRMWYCYGKHWRPKELKGT